MIGLFWFVLAVLASPFKSKAIRDRLFKKRDRSGVASHRVPIVRSDDQLPAPDIARTSARVEHSIVAIGRNAKFLSSLHEGVIWRSTKPERVEEAITDLIDRIVGFISGTRLYRTGGRSKMFSIPS
jgi:hypothetical protein